MPILILFEHAAALLEINAEVVLTDLNENALQNAKKILSEKGDVSKIHTRIMDVTKKESISEVRF